MGNVLKDHSQPGMKLSTAEMAAIRTGLLKFGIVFSPDL